MKKPMIAMSSSPIPTPNPTPRPIVSAFELDDAAAVVDVVAAAAVAAVVVAVPVGELTPAAEVDVADADEANAEDEVLPS